MEFKINLGDGLSYGYVNTDGNTNMDYQWATIHGGNMNLGSIGKSFINISDCERIIKENELMIKQLQCELKESTFRTRQLENDIVDLSNIEIENSYLRGLLKLYL